MKLSIYIPTLKCDELFDRCLASIRKSIPASCVEGVDYEIVVVENVRPLSEARNVGMRRSRGDWIATVDGDDIVADDWFREIWNAIEKVERMDDVDDIVFDSVVVGASRTYVDCYGRDSLVDARVLVDDMLRDMRIGSYVWRHVVRRRLTEGFAFDPVTVYEDHVSMPKLLSRARRVLYVAKPLYHYMTRIGSLCDSAPRMVFFDVARKRAMEFGGPAIIGASRGAYYMLYDRVDENGAAQRWIRRHIWRELFDPEIGWKWRLKFLTAFFGFVIRRPK